MSCMGTGPSSATPTGSLRLARHDVAGRPPVSPAYDAALLPSVLVVIVVLGHVIVAFSRQYAE
jgi:hypothetical protein